MESFNSLNGLYDELILFDLTKIRKRSTLVKTSVKLREIVETMELCDRKDLFGPYRPGSGSDSIIIPNKYLNHIRAHTPL